MSRGINPLQSEPFHIMFGPGAGVSQILERDGRKPVSPYEPILILRATDTEAIRAAFAYAEMLAPTNPEKAAEVKRAAQRMANFRQHMAKLGQLGP